jgi:transposase
MSTPIRVRPLTDDERQAVEDGLRSPDAFVLRRCQIIRASQRGAVAATIAEHLGCCQETVRTALHAVNRDGIAALEQGSNRPPRIYPAFDAAGGARLQDLLHRSPRSYGKPASVWTLALVAEVCATEGITAERVSGQTIHQTVGRLGVRWGRAKEWIESPDPQYAKKKPGGTG